ncbi:type IV toxin-antitoxin system AbiEi family antitoxin [Chryseoglobus sp. 28M-23]|uniref:type IV toxin-antitoxin system AbiEi family antitoxin n=1 Tax=Chryseoglobus sp. 28M-23 TaxID=2772253 RepID=UPI001746E13D|nr:type IV toxin-antitoxin system AbiEi family antitoxin [Chryseoglobus sp. 28M-23]QOD94157.1 hypothetical protein IE160_02670 [Chryseoglobus sp. 28M-23]
MKSGNNPGIAVLMNVVPPAMMPVDGINHVELRYNGTTIRLDPEWIGEGFPADVRILLNKARNPEQRGTMVVTARRMSPGAVELLTEHRLSWADAAGHAEITPDSGIYISRQKPKPIPRRMLTGMNWSPSAKRVVEYILSRQISAVSPAPTPWSSIDRISLIAEATGISPSSVAKVLLMLDNEGYTSKFGPERGPTSWRELPQRGRLLSDWAAWYKRSTHSEEGAELHVLSREPRDWQRYLSQGLTTTPWAVSGWLGASALAPFTTSVPDMIVYVPDKDFESSIERLTRHDDMTVVDRGGRVHLRSAPRFTFEFDRHIDGLPVASPVRVYADLVRSGGRALEAAEHLREIAIGF